jgi:hypothetical protein
MRLMELSYVTMATMGAIDPKATLEFGLLKRAVTA